VAAADLQHPHVLGRGGSHAPASREHRPADAEEFAKAAARDPRELILREAVDPERGCLVADYGGTEVDAALLQAITLRLLPADDPRIGATVDAVREELEHHGWLRRYRRTTGSAQPSVAFMLCTFWLVEALAKARARDEARAVILDRLRR
jgi:GH15 family glucan-1,4-alpha-glucosidase